MPSRQIQDNKYSNSQWCSLGTHILYIYILYNILYYIYIILNVTYAHLDDDMTLTAWDNIRKLNLICFNLFGITIERGYDSANIMKLRFAQGPNSGCLVILGFYTTINHWTTTSI